MSDKILNMKREEVAAVEDTDKKKRASRRPKFRAEERAYLAKLVDEKKEILESKCTSRDIRDINRKAMTWRELTAQFNSGCIHAPVQRNCDELKKKWDNLKDEAKKAAAARKKELTKTGGGTADIAVADEVLMLVESIIKRAMNPVKCEFDSDSSAFKETGPSPDVEVINLCEEGQECPSTPATSSSVSTPASSKRKPSLEVKNETKRQRNSPASSCQPKATHREELLQDRAEELHQARMGILALQQMQMQQLQMQQAERHGLWLEILWAHRDNLVPTTNLPFSAGLLAELENEDITDLS